MTWRDLANAISALPPEQLEQPVRFVEPYDKDRDGHLPVLVIAKKDIYVGPRGEETLFAKAGQPILC